jgi:hypothetical protein
MALAGVVATMGNLNGIIVQTEVPCTGHTPLPARHNRDGGLDDSKRLEAMVASLLGVGALRSFRSLSARQPFSVIFNLAFT